MSHKGPDAENAVKTGQTVSGLILGDCLDVMRRIPDSSVDMVLCDLPYGQLNKRNPSAAWDEEIPLKPLWDEYTRVTKDDAAIVLFGQGMFTARMMIAQERIWRYNLIWKKGSRSSGFLNANKMPLRNHEDIMVFYRTPPSYEPQMRVIPNKINHTRGKCHKVINRCYGRFNVAEDRFTDKKYPLSVLEFERPHPPLHPTQKPVPLCEWLIRTYTKPGDLVLDNAMGVGTTCVACIKTKRRYIGIELDKQYFRLATEAVDRELNTPKQAEFDFS